MNNKKQDSQLYKSQRFKRQNGLTIIELMISMFIGLFLLTGLVTSFLSTQKADLKRDALSEMDANADEAMRVLRHAISHAGYRSINNIRLHDNMAFYINDADVSNVDCRGSHKRDLTTVKKNWRTRDAGSKDFLTVISLADNPLDGDGNINPNALVFSDCAGGGDNRNEHAVACSTDPNQGMPDPQDAKIYSSFFINNDENNASNYGKLFCVGNRGGTEVIASDIETIQFLYGIKTETGNISFKTATQTSAANEWSQVTSVQVGILMRSSSRYLFDKPSEKSVYQVLDYKATISDSDKRRLFKVYKTTINIPNRG